MHSFVGILIGLVSVALISVCVGDQYVLSLRGSMKFCGKNSNRDPNACAKPRDDIRLGYKCTNPYSINYITIEYQDTPFDGCFVKILENNNSLCYTTSPFHHGKGMTVKAEPCYSFPGQQLWNFEQTDEGQFKIHPANHSELCLTAVRPWMGPAAYDTTPLSVQPCFAGNETNNEAFRDTWNSACDSQGFKDFYCSTFDPSVNCRVKS